MWIDNTITLVVINVTERKERQKTRLTRTGLTNNIYVTRTVATEHAELVFDAAKVGKAESGNIFIETWITSEHWKLGWWFGGFAGGPDDVWRFDVRVR